MFHRNTPPAIFSTCVLVFACSAFGFGEKDSLSLPKFDTTGPRHTSDGAPAGLAGCLNTGLYTRGSHRVITEHNVHTKGTTGGALDFEKEDLRKSDITYAFAFGGMRDANYVSKNSSGVPIAQYRIVNDTLVELGIYRGAAGFVAHPEPSSVYFDLKEGETRRSEQLVQTNAVDEFGNALLADTDFQFTYLGREEIAVGADRTMFKTCRVLVEAVEEEPFIRRATYWYAVGSGIPVRRSNYWNDPYDPGGMREITVTRELFSATIDGLPVKP